jgi:hypothetical protein
MAASMDLRPFYEMRRLYKTSAMIGAAMASGVVLLGVAAIWMQSKGTMTSATQALTGVARVVLMILSLVQLVTVPLINQVFLGPVRIKGPIYQNEAIWPGYIKSLFQASLVTYTICEVPSLFGLGLYFMTRHAGDFFIFAAISVIAFILYFPRYEQWEYELRKIN